MGLAELSGQKHCRFVPSAPLGTCAQLRKLSGQGQSPSSASLPLPRWVLSQLIALGSILEISDGDINTDHRKATD